VMNQPTAVRDHVSRVNLNVAAVNA